jgi:uncharacterized protein
VWVRTDDFDAFEAALVASFGIGILVVVPTLLLGYKVESLPILVAGLIAGQLGFLAVGILYTRRRELRIPISWPTRRSMGYVVVGTVLALVVGMGMLLLDFFGLAPESAIEETAAMDPALLLALAVLSILLVAPVEEYLFRGVIQGRLRESLGLVSAILGASLLFGSLHFANYIGSTIEVLAGVVVVTCVGAVLGALYELTDNLTVPIAVHAVYNVILSMWSYLTL